MSKQLIDLLGGAERGRTRVRGFAEWNPSADSLLLVKQINTVLAEYSAYLPLTLRQIFYRLVGAHDFPKTKQAYKNLGECLNRARRARMIDMSVIRDGGGTRAEPHFWKDADEFLANMRWQAKELRLDRTAGQPSRLVVTCEAAGMVEQLARVADPYGVTVLSSGGFESTTEKHAFAADLVDQDRPTEALLVGDHDNSGVHMAISFDEDVQAFARDLGGDVTFTRLAVTPEQIRRLRLPTAPPNEGDKRAFAGETCQAEAIAPDELARILRDAITKRLDRAAYDRVLRQERRIQAELVRRLR